MKTELFPDKKSNSTLKYLHVGRQNHFLQSAILPVSKAYSIVAHHLLKCKTNIKQYIYPGNKSNIKIFGTGIIPVSYTHLDVYKRQSYGLLCVVILSFFPVLVIFVSAEIYLNF